MYVPIKEQVRKADLDSRVHVKRKVQQEITSDKLLQQHLIFSGFDVA